MKKKKITRPQKRTKWTAEHKAKAFHYYMIGLNLSEISKLVDNCPVRTLENWQQAEKWTEQKHFQGIKQKAYEMHQAGETYEQIAKTLKKGRVTVWRYITSVKEQREVKQC